MTILDPEEFGKSFTVRVDYQIQLTNRAQAYLRDLYKRGHQLNDVLEELTGYLSDRDNCNIIDAHAELNFIEDLFPEQEGT